MTCITYLVTGANRGKRLRQNEGPTVTACEGLGKAIVAALLLREEAVVVAAVRDPNHGTATSLHEFPQSRTAKLLLVKIDASSSNDQKTAINELKNKHGVETLDVVIGNAGIIAGTPTVLESTAEGLMNHYQINAINTVLLYQAVRPSLLGSKNPRFIVTSGSGGSIAQQDKIRVPLAEYGPSRAAVNWLIRKVHFEEERISTVLVDPG